MNLQKMKAIVDGLKEIIDTEINLMDENGYIFHSSNATQIGHYDFIMAKDDYVYCKSCGEDKLILSLKGVNQDTEKIIKILEVFLNTNIKSFSKNDFIKSILLHTIPANSLKDLGKKYDLLLEEKVQIIVIEGTQKLMATLEEILSALLPQEIIVRVKENSFAIVKKVDEESHTFPSSLLDTISSELLYEVKIGIGIIVENIYDWHFSYATAENFLEIGKLFLPSRKIYSFKNLAIPFMLKKIEPNDLQEVLKHFHCAIDQLFSNTELLNTALLLFKNNLNISDTAKSLFIHRNTLIYRLNKIQDITGYDLRDFEDAMLFHVMLHSYIYLRSENNQQK